MSKNVGTITRVVTCRIKSRAQVPKSSTYMITETRARPAVPKASSAMSSYPTIAFPVFAFTSP